MNAHVRPTLSLLQLLVALCVAALVSVSAVSPAVAQQNEQHFAQYNSEQQKLNEQGVRAIIKKDYALAIALLEESSDIGELNVTYLNLGRAYQKMGDCKMARETFAKVETAPKVANPSPKLIAKKLQEYRDELAKSCTKPEPAAKSAKATTPSPDSTEQAAPEKAAADEKAATKKPEPAEPNPAASAAVAQPEQHPDAARRAPAAGPSTLGWVLTSGGALLLGGGVGALLYARSLRSDITDATVDGHGIVTSMNRQTALDKKSTASTLDAVGLGMTIGGAVLAAGGVYLIVTHDAESQSTVALQPGVDQMSLVWTATF